MGRIIILHEELEAQMRMYLALCENYLVEIAEDEATLMRMIRRKNPSLVFLDANFSGFNNNGRSITKMIQKIKKKYHDLKIVTVLDETEQEPENGLAFDISDGLLFPPIDAPSILRSVQELLSTYPAAIN